MVADESGCAHRLAPARRHTMRRHTWNWLAVLVIASTGLARTVLAEPFIDAEIGGAVTDNANVDVTSSGFGSASAENDFETSFEAGARGGYWFDEIPWLGVAGTVSYFEPNVRVPGVTEFGRSDVSEFPITAQVMVRALLAQSPEFPYGQIQPYFGVGPGMFITHLHDDDTHFSDSSADIGVDVRAGMYIMVTSRIGVFGEYRFTHTDPGLSDDHVHHGLGD